MTTTVVTATTTSTCDANMTAALQAAAPAGPMQGYLDILVAVTIGLASLLVLQRLLASSKAAHLSATTAPATAASKRNSLPATLSAPGARRKSDGTRSMLPRTSTYFAMPWFADTVANKHEFLESLLALGDDVLHSWLLVKKGAARGKHWKKRYVMLDGNARLKYYANADAARRNVNIKGSLTVHFVKPANPGEFGANTLEVRGTLGGTYFFRAEDSMAARKWLCVLTKRAIQGAVPGRIDVDVASTASTATTATTTTTTASTAAATKDQDKAGSKQDADTDAGSRGAATAAAGQSAASAPSLKAHALEAFVEDMSYTKEASMRQFYLVVKFKSELHDHSAVPVGQTTPTSCDKGVITWQEKLAWHFQDHVCDECDECHAVGSSTGCFGGLPDIMVFHVYEIHLRCLTTKVGQVAISLKEMFGYTGMKEASIACSWPVIATNDSVLGNVALTLKYEVSNAGGAALAPFLVTTEDERELLGEYAIHASIKDCAEFFNRFYANGTTDRWQGYFQARGDTEVEVGEWSESKDYGGQVRVVSSRALTNASIGPASTMTTNTQHILFTQEKGPDPERFVHESKVFLHDIPYGDCFTVEQVTIVEKDSASGALRAKVYLGIPFSKGCMFKSKIISATKEGVSGSMKLCFEELNKTMDGQSAAVAPFLASAAEELQLLGEYELHDAVTDAVDFFELFYANSTSHRWKGYYDAIGETEHEIGEWANSTEHGGQVRIINFRAQTGSPIGPATTKGTSTQHVAFREKADANPECVVIENRMVLHDIPYGDCFYVETKNVIERRADAKLVARMFYNVVFVKSTIFRGKVTSATKDGLVRSTKMIFEQLNIAVENERGAGANGGRASEPGAGRGARRLLARLNSNLDGSVALEEIFENQRVSIFGKWGPNHLLPTDRARFTNRNGDVELSFEQITLPPHWMWTTPWKIDKDYTDCDDEGWSYATDFPRFKSHLARGKSNMKRLGASVRRRRWIRMMAYVGPDGDHSQLAERGLVTVSSAPALIS
ncbi:TPA: hypothetical protein N0F65_012114 [Lagenidium giganteum]|uniref:VASt domain-containing protein n=1 Tax=Lagenidium giganteum TaxID=4803 RepID=A0AAV2YPL2_9STRA|nr:TPA: hypothetical protein N0F65_012114 [Lagenidium giganteum]